MSLDIKRAVPHQFTSVQHKLRQFGATLPPAFCMFVFYEQKCVEPTCDTILIAILILAWCLHEVRLEDADPLLQSIELPRVSAQCV